MRSLVLLIGAFLLSSFSLFCNALVLSSRCNLLAARVTGEPVSVARRLSIRNSNLKESSSYVPDGLTQEEYQRIKQQEADELKQMDFGAFGPRFRRTATPEGDWLLMRSLWTAGFNSSQRTSEDGASKSSPRWIGVVNFVRTHGPAYLLAYCLVEMLFSAVLVARTPELTSPTSLKVTISIIKSIHPRDFFLSFVQFRWMKEAVACLLNWTAQDVLTCFARFPVVKLAVIALLSWPSNRYITHMNRKHLWSIQRTVTSSIVVMGMLLAFCIALAMKWKPFLLAL